MHNDKGNILVVRQEESLDGIIEYGDITMSALALPTNPFFWLARGHWES
jgi:hypothetical protein